MTDPIHQLRAENELLRLEIAELRKRPTPETYTLTLAAVEAQCEATKKAQSLLETACKDWADDDTEIKAICEKHGISENDIPGELKPAAQCVEEMSIKFTALRTKAIEALEKAATLNTGQDCPSENMAVVVAAMNALTALRGDNAGGER